MAYHDPITSLSDLKESTEHHVHNISQFMLLPTVEHAILRLQILADNGGQQVSQSFVVYLCF